MADKNCIFHISTAADFAAARASGAHCAPSLASEGFIHLSQAHQVQAVLQAFYPGRTDLVLMVVDPTLLTAPLRYEAPASLGKPGGLAAFEREQLFPHLYGPLNGDAIVGVIEAAGFDGLQIHSSRDTAWLVGSCGIVLRCTIAVELRASPCQEV